MERRRPASLQEQTCVLASLSSGQVKDMVSVPLQFLAPVCVKRKKGDSILAVAMACMLT